MNKTLVDGDYLNVVETTEADYGDIVVINSKAHGEWIIKRVIAKGGDIVQIKDGKVHVNGEALEEDYINEDTYLGIKYTKIYNGEYGYKPYVVPDNTYYVLGDNRGVSSDSRQNGVFVKSSIVGVVPDWSVQTKGVKNFFYNLFGNTSSCTQNGA